MIIYCHRGITELRECQKPLFVENSLEAVEDAIQNGFSAEIDLWAYGDKLMIGHNSGEEEVPESWLHLNYGKLLIHAKNSDALHYLNQNRSLLHYFWHGTDQFTLTSEGIPVVFPGRHPIPGSIIVLPEEYPQVPIAGCYGIITKKPYLYTKSDGENE